MSRQQLHTLIDTIDEKDIDLLQALLLKFIPSDIPLPDESKQSNKGKQTLKIRISILTMKYGAKKHIHKGCCKIQMFHKIWR